MHMHKLIFTLGFAAYMTLNLFAADPKPLGPPDDTTIHSAQKALLNSQREFANARAAVLEAQIKLQQIETQYGQLIEELRKKYGAGPEWSVSADLKWVRAGAGETVKPSPAEKKPEGKQ